MDEGVAVLLGAIISMTIVFGGVKIMWRTVWGMIRFWKASTANTTMRKDNDKGTYVIRRGDVRFEEVDW